MMRKILDKLRDQSGGSLILGITVTFFMVALSLAVMVGIQTRATVAAIQTAAQQVLDDYTDEQGRRSETSFKSGTDHTVTLDQAAYTAKLQQALGIGSDNTGKTDGRTRFVLSDITLTGGGKGEIDTAVSMHIRVPIYWDNTEVTAVEGTITVRSRYEGKLKTGFIIAISLRGNC